MGRGEGMVLRGPMESGYGREGRRCDEPRGAAGESNARGRTEKIRELRQRWEATEDWEQLHIYRSNIVIYH